MSISVRVNNSRDEYWNDAQSSVICLSVKDHGIQGVNGPPRFRLGVKRCLIDGWSTFMETVNVNVTIFYMTIHQNAHHCPILPREATMLAWSWDRNFVRSSVCPSVCHTRASWQNERIYFRYFDITWKENHCSFLTPTAVGGQRPLPRKICTRIDPRL